MSKWQVAQGSTESWDVPIVDENQDPMAYTGAEVLSGRIWPGGRFAAVANLIPTWKEPANGVTNVVISSAVTSTLDAQIYWLELAVTDIQGSKSYYRGPLEILADTGTDAAPPVYCTYAHMLKYLSWIGDLQTEMDSAGFLIERGDARSWTDDCIQRHYRGGGGLSRDNYFLPWPQYIPGNPNRLASIYRSGAKDTTLQGWLDNGGLNVTNQVIEANACYALGRVLERQIGEKSRAENPYADLARKFFARAENAITMLEAEVDSSASPTRPGYQSTAIVIKMANVDTLDG